MGAHHHHHHVDLSPGTLPTSDKSPITTAFWLNTIFAILEVIGGLYTNSVSILSNALHDFGDSLSLGCAFYFEKMARKKGDAIYTYGYKRFALLGAFTNSIVLIVGSVFILQEAFSRFFNPASVHTQGMLFLAVAGVLVNGIAAVRLKRGHSINERVVSLHFIEDMLGWIAVLVVGAIMMLKPIPVLDPLLSVGISGYILFNVFKNLKEVWRVVLQGIPDKDLNDKIAEKIQLVAGVVDHHDVHVWSLDGRYHIASLHLVLAEKDLSDSDRIKCAVRERLMGLNLQHVTIETEVESQRCATCGLK